MGAALRNTPRPRTSRKYTKSASLALSSVLRSRAHAVGPRGDLQHVFDDGRPGRLAAGRRVLQQQQRRFERIERADERQSAVLHVGKRVGRHPRALVADAPRRLELLEQTPRPLVDAGHDPHDVLALLRIAPTRHHARRVAHQFLEAVIAHDDAEILRRYILELMRLVQHRGVTIGNDRAVVAVAHGRVGEQQVMVHDDEVGFGGALAHARDEALLIERAGRAEAVLGRRGQLRPEREVLRQVGQLRAVASLGLDRPPLEHRQQDPLVHFVAACTESAKPLLPCEVAGLHRLKPMQAEVIAAALHHGGGERVANRLRDDRQVLVDDLFLEVLRAGRDEHAPPAQQRRNQIGERLAGSGPGLDEQDGFRLDGVGDRVGHLALGGTRLEARHRSTKRTVRREGRSHARRQCLRRMFWFSGPHTHRRV